MGDENKGLLDEVIETEVERLTNLNPGSQEHTTAVESLTKLYKLKLEEDRNSIDQYEKAQSRENDESFKTIQLKESVKDRRVRIGIAAAELILPLMFYGCWMRRGFKFEENGTFTSQTFRGLFSRFKPTKK